MKAPTIFLLTLGLLFAGSCKSKTDPEPDQISDTDVLMKSNGYWQWENSTTLGARLTPVSVGYSRELVFKSDGLVHIYHNRKPAMQPAYQLSTGVLPRCNSSPQPIAITLVRYAAEPQIPNNELRSYLIGLSATDTTLYITGEAACVDGGYYETYRWHRH